MGHASCVEKRLKEANGELRRQQRFALILSRNGFGNYSPRNPSDWI